MDDAPPARDSGITRAAILRAGMDLFARHGFEMVGVRSIGAEAGVDPSLINRYFGRKEDLFVEVLKACGLEWRRIWGSRVGFAERLVAEVLHRPDGGDILRGVLIMLRSSGSKRARTLIKQTFGPAVFTDLEDWIEGPDADVRARLLLALVSGMAFAKDVSGDLDLSDARSEALGQHLAQAINYLLSPQPA